VGFVTTTVTMKWERVRCHLRLPGHASISLGVQQSGPVSRSSVPMPESGTVGRLRLLGGDHGVGGVLGVGLDRVPQMADIPCWPRTAQLRCSSHRCHTKASGRYPDK